MAIEFTVDDERSLYHCRYLGEVTDEEHFAAWVDFIESERVPSGYLEFIDMSSLKSATLSPTGLQKLAEYRSKHQRRVKIPQKYLILAPSALGYGLSRMYHTYVDTPHANVKFVNLPHEAEKHIAEHVQQVAKHQSQISN